MKKIFVSGIFIIMNIITLWGQTSSTAIFDIPMIRINSEDVFFEDSLSHKTYPFNNKHDNNIVIKNIEWGNVLNLNTIRLNNSDKIEINLIKEDDTPKTIYLDGKNTGFIIK